MRSVMKVGFSAIDVTPREELPLGRLFGTREKITSVRWPLMLRVAAFSSESQRVLIFGLDKNRLLDSAIHEIREALSEGVGLSPAEVVISCSHTHNVPFAARWLVPEDTDGYAYLDYLKEQFVVAASAAIGNLTPAELYFGRTNVPGLNSNRRVLYNTSVGKQVGTHGPENSDDFAGFEGPTDDELMFLHAKDKDGKSLGGLVNFACHPTTMYSEPVWSSDYIGPLTEKLTSELGGTFVFLNGAAGNLSPNRDVGKAAGESGSAKAECIGWTLAENIIGHMEECRSVKSPSISIERETIRIPQRLPSLAQLEFAREVVAGTHEDMDPNEMCRKLFSRDYAMRPNSLRFLKWLSEEIVGMWEWQRRRALRNPYDLVEIQSMTLGDVAFAFFPSELFCEYGLAIKERAPFKDTFVVEMSNGWHGYIPTLQGFDYGGYETCLAYQSHLIPEAGNMMIDSALTMLRKIESARS